MHFGQIGFSQTRQRSTVLWPGCLVQTGIAGAASTAGADAGASCAAARRNSRRNGSAGGASTGAGFENSCRINAFTYSDESRPHAGQTNRIGLWTISGETSKVYLEPHEH